MDKDFWMFVCFILCKPDYGSIIQPILTLDTLHPKIKFTVGTSLKLYLFWTQMSTKKKCK